MVALFGLCLFDLVSTSKLINECAVLTQFKIRKGLDQQVTTTQGFYSFSEFFDVEEKYLFQICVRLVTFLRFICIHIVVLCHCRTVL